MRRFRLPPLATRLHFPECRRNLARPGIAPSRLWGKWPRIIMATLRTSVVLWGLLTGSRGTERVCFRSRVRPRPDALPQQLPGPCGTGIPCRRLASEAGKWPDGGRSGRPRSASGWRDTRGALPHPRVPPQWSLLTQWSLFCTSSVCRRPRLFVRSPT